MGDYLKEVLRMTPSTWTGNSYDSCNYVVIDVDSSSDEYEGIVDALRSKNDSVSKSISKIERVQHPFAYGRYILRKEQFIKRNGQVRDAKRYFLLVKKTKIKEALEYNMDKRRTPYSALGTDSSRSSGQCIVVVQSLVRMNSIERDCDMYPEYVIYYDE